MFLIRDIIGVSAVTFGLASGYCWVKEANAKVLAEPGATVGVGFGGSPVNVRDHEGAILDLLQSYSLQSKWNSKAAYFSAAAAITGEIAYMFPA
jgi:hypothetical protein